MVDVDDDDHDAIVLHPGDRAVVADAILPQTRQLAEQGKSHLPRINAGVDVASQRSNDALGNLRIELTELLARAGRELKRPGRAHASSPPA